MCRPADHTRTVRCYWANMRDRGGIRIAADGICFYIFGRVKRSSGRRSAYELTAQVPPRATSRYSPSIAGKTPEEVGKGDGEKRERKGFPNQHSGREVKPTKTNQQLLPRLIGSREWILTGFPGEGKFPRGKKKIKGVSRRPR